SHRQARCEARHRRRYRARTRAGGVLMARYLKNTDLDDDAPSAELVSARLDPSAGQIVFPDDDEIAPTRADLAYGYARPYLPTQNGGYLGQVLTPDQISYLMGPQ